MAITDKIHPIYSLWFLWVDPILTLVGMYGNFIDHDLAMQAFFTDYPPTGHFRCFIYQIGGMGTSYLIILVVLLRYTHDIFIWKTVQLAILPADFTMLTAIHIGMRISGNLALADWRWEDWFSIVVTGICTVLRIAFVLGVGVKDTRGRAKRAEFSQEKAQPVGLREMRFWWRTGMRMAKLEFVGWVSRRKFEALLAPQTHDDLKTPVPGREEFSSVVQKHAEPHY